MWGSIDLVFVWVVEVDSEFLVWESKMDLVFGWVVEIAVISVWVVELDSISA